MIRASLRFALMLLTAALAVSVGGCASTGAHESHHAHHHGSDDHATEHEHHHGTDGHATRGTTRVGTITITRAPDADLDGLLRTVPLLRSSAHGRPGASLS